MPARLSTRQRHTLARLYRMPDCTATLHLATGQALEADGYVRRVAPKVEGINYFKLTAKGVAWVEGNR